VRKVLGVQCSILRKEEAKNEKVKSFFFFERGGDFGSETMSRPQTPLDILWTPGREELSAQGARR
jgi:hypothetical protein